MNEQTRQLTMGRGKGSGIAEAFSYCSLVVIQETYCA